MVSFPSQSYCVEQNIRDQERQMNEFNLKTCTYLFSNTSALFPFNTIIIIIIWLYIQRIRKSVDINLFSKISISFSLFSLENCSGNHFLLYTQLQHHTTGIRYPMPCVFVYLHVYTFIRKDETTTRSINSSLKGKQLNFRISTLI